MKTHAVIGLFVLSGCLFVYSCNKKTPPVNNPNPITCSLAGSTIVVNDTQYNIIQDTAYATLNNTFYAEHIVATGHGVSVEFEGTTFPAAGDYTVTTVFSEVVIGSKKVYMQYYFNGQSYGAQSGIAKVSGSGAQAITDFCKVKFKESFGEEKTISLKSDME